MVRCARQTRQSNQFHCVHMFNLNSALSHTMSSSVSGRQNFGLYKKSTVSRVRVKPTFFY